MRNNKIIFKKYEKNIYIDQYVINRIINTSNSNRKINILISGGKTFDGFYKNIIKSKINLSNITFIMSDERLVNSNSETSNIYNIKKNLISKMPKDQRPKILLLPNNYMDISNKSLSNIYGNTIPPAHKIEFSLLGVGIDGHIASIFFDKNEVVCKNRYILMSKNNNENFTRISVNLNYLCKIKDNYVVINNENKKNILNLLFKLDFSKNDMPILKLINDSKYNINIMYNSSIL